MLKCVNKLCFNYYPHFLTAASFSLHRMDRNVLKMIQDE